MENTNQFKLEVAVEVYLQQLQEKGNYTSDDILELKSHLSENVRELKRNDLDDEEAFIIAKKRLGKEEMLSIEYNKVNGNRFLNRELFILILSISTYLLFYFSYLLVTGTIRQYAIFVNKNMEVWGIVNYLFNILFTTGILYLIFNCKKYIRVVERLFIKSPVNFSLIFIALILFVWVFHIDMGRKLFDTSFLSSEEITNRYEVFLLDHTLGTFINGGLLFICLISISIAFVRSYKKIDFLDNIINHSGYLPLFIIGLFWDGIAASARMINHHTNLSVYAFGIVWLIGMTIFNVHLRKNVLMRNIIFISFGFMLELAAGIWMNPGLKAGAPVSVYFIALVTGSALGFTIANFIKRKNIKLAV